MSLPTRMLLLLCGALLGGCPTLLDYDPPLPDADVCSTLCDDCEQCYPGFGCQPCDPTSRQGVNNGCWEPAAECREGPARVALLCIRDRSPGAEGARFRCAECDPWSGDEQAECDGSSCITHLLRCGACDPARQNTCPAGSVCALGADGDPDAPGDWACLPCDPQAPAADAGCPGLDGGGFEVCADGPRGLGCYRCADDADAPFDHNCSAAAPVCVDGEACVPCLDTGDARDEGCPAPGPAHCVEHPRAGVGCTGCDPLEPLAPPHRWCLETDAGYRPVVCDAALGPSAEQCGREAPACLDDGGANRCVPCDPSTGQRWCAPYGRACLGEADAGACVGRCLAPCPVVGHVQDPVDCSCGPCDGNRGAGTTRPCPGDGGADVCVDGLCRVCDPADHGTCPAGLLCRDLGGRAVCASCDEHGDCADHPDGAACLAGPGGVGARCQPCDCGCADPTPRAECRDGRGCICAPCRVAEDCGPDRHCYRGTCGECDGVTLDGCGIDAPICRCDEANRCGCEPCDGDAVCVGLDLGEWCVAGPDRDEPHRCGPCRPGDHLGCDPDGPAPTCLSDVDGVRCAGCSSHEECLWRAQQAVHPVCNAAGRCGPCESDDECQGHRLGSVCRDGGCQ